MHQMHHFSALLHSLQDELFHKSIFTADMTSFFELWSVYKCLKIMRMNFMTYWSYDIKSFPAYCVHMFSCMHQVTIEKKQLKSQMRMNFFK